MNKNTLQQVAITNEDVQHLKGEALKAHRRYLSNGTEASYKLYKRLSKVWLDTKAKYDLQQLTKSQRSLF